TFADVQTLPVGWQFQLNGVGTTYVLTTAVAASADMPLSSFAPALTPPADGTPFTVTPVASLATTRVLTLQGAAATDASPVAVLRITQENGEAVSVNATPWGSLLATLAAAAVTPVPGSTAIT